MPNNVKSSWTLFISTVELPLAYRRQLSFFHVSWASIGKRETCAGTTTWSCSSPHAFTSRLPRFLSWKRKEFCCSQNGIFLFIARQTNNVLLHQFSTKNKTGESREFRKIYVPFWEMTVTSLRWHLIYDVKGLLKRNLEKHLLLVGSQKLGQKVWHSITHGFHE